MGILRGSICYLSGAIEYAPDHGVSWRQDFIQKAKAAKLGILCLDPTNKPEIEGWDSILKGHLREDQQYQQQLQGNGEFKELQRYVSGYRRLDLRLVDYSDFLVVAVNPTIPQWGTANEVYMAESQHKPIFFVGPSGEIFPRWLFDILDITEEDYIRNLFLSVDHLIEHLCKINNGEIKINDEWVLIRQALEKIRQESEA